MKQMIRPWTRTVKLILTAVILTLCLAAPASAATNKALAIRNALFMNAKKSNGYHGAELCAAVLKNDKLKKKGMSLSATFYFPKKSLKKGDSVNLYTCVYLQDPKAGKNNKTQTASDEWPYLYGNVPGIYCCNITMNSKGKPLVKKVSLKTSKAVGAGSTYFTLSQKGSYYIVKIKKLPLADVYFPYAPDSDGNPIALDTSKNYLLSPSIQIMAYPKNRKWKGNLYLDNIKLVTATKTQKITFNKKDYKGLYSSNWQNSDSSQKLELREPMK